MGTNATAVAKGLEAAGAEPDNSLCGKAFVQRAAQYEMYLYRRTHPRASYAKRRKHYAAVYAVYADLWRWELSPAFFAGRGVVFTD